MFTGIVEETGRIARLKPGAEGAELTIGAELVLEGVALGDSISVNGVCLTVVSFDSSGFVADVSGETLRRTTLSALREGTRVNLERAATPSSRLGGHIVQGHVDCVGRFVGAAKEGDFWTVTIGFDSALPAPATAGRPSAAIRCVRAIEPIPPAHR